MGKKVAVVGGTGFLGGHVVEHLVLAGYSPVVVARDPDRINEVLPGVDVETRAGDPLVPSSLRRAFGECTYVLSMPGEAGVFDDVPAASHRDWSLRLTVDATTNVLRAARDAGVRRVVVNGSCTTRYQSDAAVASEESPITGAKVIRDPYVRGKVLQENAVRAFSRGTGLQTVMILPGWMVGPRDTGPSPIGAYLLARLNGGRHTRASPEGAFPVTDVRDVARAHVSAMRVRDPRPAYLLVGRTVPTRAWHGIVSRVTGIPSDARAIPAIIATPTALAYEALALLRHVPAQLSRSTVRHARQSQEYDCTLARDHLRVSFTPLETTLRDTVRWYAENGWITDEARLAIVASALERAAYDANLGAPSPEVWAVRA